MRRLFTSSSKLVLPLTIPLLLLWGFDHYGVHHIDSQQSTDPIMRDFYKSAADIVIVGSSVTRTAFDEQVVQERLQTAGYDKQVFKYHLSGTGPPMWYLAIKNVILSAAKKPEVVVLAARDYVLVRNHESMRLKYRKAYFPIYAKKYEPVLERKLFQNAPRAATMDQLLYANSNIYYNRDVYQKTIRRWFFDAFMSCGRLVSGRKDSQPETAGPRAAFESEGGLAEALRNSYNEPSEKIDYLDVPDEAEYLNDTWTLWANSEELEGQELIESTFIPDLIELCRQNNVHFILVRHFPHPTYNKDNLVRGQECWQAVVEYLAANAPDVATIDLSTCPGITAEHFYRREHYIPEAQTILTDVFSERLVKLLDMWNGKPKIAKDIP